MNDEGKITNLNGVPHEFYQTAPGHLETVPTAITELWHGIKRRRAERKIAKSEGEGERPFLIAGQQPVAKSAPVKVGDLVDGLLVLGVRAGGKGYFLAASQDTPDESITKSVDERQHINGDDAVKIEKTSKIRTFLPGGVEVDPDAVERLLESMAGTGSDATRAPEYPAQTFSPGSNEPSTPPQPVYGISDEMNVMTRVGLNFVMKPIDPGIVAASDFKAPTPAPLLLKRRPRYSDAWLNEGTVQKSKSIFTDVVKQSSTETEQIFGVEEK